MKTQWTLSDEQIEQKMALTSDNKVIKALNKIIESNHWNATVSSLFELKCFDLGKQ